MTESKDVYLKQLVKQYGDTIAENELNLEIPLLKYFCLVGPSRLGKYPSTLSKEWGEVLKMLNINLIEKLWIFKYWLWLNSIFCT